MRQFILRAAFGLLFFFIAGCEHKPETVTMSGSTMGTTYHITLLAPEGFDQKTAHRELDELLKAFSQVTSTYIPDSEVNKIQVMPLDQWVDISQTLWDILLTAMEVNWLTGGAFDVTVSPLVDLWGFGPDDMHDQIPPVEEIETAKAQVGFNHMQFDLSEPKMLLKQHVKVDLSGVAKGYGVDVVAEWLQRQSIHDYLVEIGGEIRASGKSPRGDEWRIGIEKPDSLVAGSVQQAIRVSGVGMATSGDYRNYFEKNGKRYSHTINPKTGYPIDHKTASVTVIAETSAYADAMATGFMVLGAEKSMKLAKTHNLAVYIIEKSDEGFRVLYSPAFEPYLD